MPISSAGIGSGLDVNSIVSQLIAIERQPIVALKSKTAQLQTQISAFGQLQSKFSTLRDAASKLSLPSHWDVTKASTTGTAVTASTGGGAQAGNYSLVVDRLAAGQTLAAPPLTGGPSAVFGSGQLRIELGNFELDPPQPKSGATAVTLTIDPARNTLADVRDQINAAGAGVNASIVSDVSGSRLVLRSAQTGVENGFRVEVLTDDDGNAGDASGLSTLAFDPGPGKPASAMTRSQLASNAAATINGLAVESSSNTLAGTIEGMTLILRQVGAAEVTVEPDTDALKKSVDEFVAAYNASITLLREQTRYDPATKQAGPLQGDRAGISMLAQLRGVFSGAGGASSTYARLADVGLDLNTDGTIKVDSTKLGGALANGAELRKLFANVDTVAPEKTGYANQFKNWLNLSLGSEGPLDSRTQSLNERVRSNEKAQERLEDRVARTQVRLQQQYSALDTKMGELSGLANYVSQQMSMLNNTNYNR